MHEPDETNSPQPLVFRSYRRHRKQSRWGTASLIVPCVAIFWCVFWYLMMNRTKMPGAGNTSGISKEWITLMTGTAVLCMVGIGFATAGMLDGYHKHGRAAAGLAINAVLLVAIGITLFLRVFSQSV